MERDCFSLNAWERTKDFNSHAHVERDSVTQTVAENVGISTHTLTWSVTYSLTALALYYTNFNSHAHVERDS